MVTSDRSRSNSGSASTTGSEKDSPGFNNNDTSNHSPTSTSRSRNKNRFGKKLKNKVAKPGKRKSSQSSSSSSSNNNNVGIVGSGNNDDKHGKQHPDTTPKQKRSGSQQRQLAPPPPPIMENNDRPGIDDSCSSTSVGGTCRPEDDRSPAFGRKIFDDEEIISPAKADCMSRFSSVRGPSPAAKAGSDAGDFPLDASMDTTVAGIGADGSMNNMDATISGTEDGSGDGGYDDDATNNITTRTKPKRPSATSSSSRRSRVRINQRKTSGPSSKEDASSTTATKNNSSHALQQEYNVDHSCSTPLERLVRDIGNTFRQWHVHGGCDWHVSLDWAERMEREAANGGDDLEGGSARRRHEEERASDGDISAMDTTMDNYDDALAAAGVDTSMDNNFMSMNACAQGFMDRGRQMNSWMADQDANKIPSDIAVKEKKMKPQSPSPIKTAGNHDCENYGAVRCIRTKKIKFQTAGYSFQNGEEDGDEEESASVTWNRRQYAIPLVLKLWDAPYIPADMQAKKKDKRLNNNDDESDIPKALKPEISPSAYSLIGELGFQSPGSASPQFYTDPSGNKKSCSFSSNLKTGLTQDISSLFGIGQHITISLDMEGAKNDIQSLYDDIHAYIENQIHEALEEARSRELLREQQRRRRRKKRRMLQRQQMKQRAKCEKNGTVVDENKQYPLGGLVGSQSSSSDMEGEEQVVFDNELYEGNDQGIFGLSHDNSDSDEDGTDDDASDDSSAESNAPSSSLQGLDNLNGQEIQAQALASLTSILQTALNLAASENECSIPVFGIWGDYNEGEALGGNSLKHHSNIAPPYIPSSCLEQNLWQVLDHKFDDDDEYYDGQYHESNDDDIGKLLLSSPILSGSCQSTSAKGSTFRSSHRVYYIPQQTSVLPLHLTTLNGLANVLLAQSPSSSTLGRGVVHLTAARHCYRWEQQHHSSLPVEGQHWRGLKHGNDNHNNSAPGAADGVVKAYRAQCRNRAIAILERASSPWVHKTVPIWGPSEGDPLLSLTASVSWGVIPVKDQDEPPPPLLQLPLKIRSSNIGSSELLDMESALQSAALDPIGTSGESFGPREPIFLASAEFDANMPCATLSANTRCVLAALLRCGSLGLDALPGHLTNKEVLAKIGRGMAGENTEESKNSIQDMTESERVLYKAMDLAEVGAVTKRLTEALDWGEIDVDDLSMVDFDRAIMEALRRIESTMYPAPPAEVFSSIGDYDLSSNTNRKMPAAVGDDGRCSQSKGTPPGRLLSVLFAHMARLRTPPAMMRLWLSFVEELRTRWDQNESLPNLGFVPGLDGTNEDEGAQQHDQNSKVHWGLRKADTRVLGHRAEHAAFVNSSEPDPDRDHCIVNQKLQVYNICIECKMSTEALHEKRVQHDHQYDSMESSVDGSVASRKHTSNSSDDDEFFDPEEEEQLSFDLSPDREQQGSNNIERMLMHQASVMSPLTSHNNRIGARCPVPDGMPLIESGDQLYAPYLQRTMPMTDEEEQQQKKFLGVVNSKHDGAEERPSIKSRITIAQRLQKPKLLSDMSSFKAANQGAVFEDFVQWYGNPENPLSEEISGETARLAYEYRSTLPPTEAKKLALKEASEAIAILMSLRAFWEDTWEEAEPVPAFDQEPLFDPYSTVEMVLHSFETIHPALLMNQVLAVVLSNAKFALEAACDGRNAARVRSVRRGLLNLKNAISAALKALTDDAADGFLHLAPKTTSADDSDGPLVYVSTSTIMKCEEACNVIGELEILLSRAQSLLLIFPEEYDLVDSILQGCSKDDSQFIFLERPQERSAFLGSVKRYQAMMNPGIASSSLDASSASPAMREYVLHNVESSSPCQLSARLVPNMDEASDTLIPRGSLLLALTKSSHRDIRACL